MATNRKEYELLFKLQAALGGNFNSSFKSAMAVTNQLQGSLVKINSIQGKIDGYQKQSKATENSKDKLSQLSAEHERLRKKMEIMGPPTKKLQSDFEKSGQQVEKATEKFTSQEKKLKDLRDELRKSGVNTKNLGEENDRLTKSYERTKKEQEDFARIIAQQEKTKSSISKTRGQLIGTIGVAAALGTAIYAGPVQGAMKFESAMADVVKVVDGLKDGKTGQLTQSYYDMKKGLIDLSAQVPMTAEDLTKIAASAGQAGIARDEIIGFSEDAAKMGIAFDVTAEQAGDWMAKWRTAFGMSQSGVVELADKVNMLSDRTASSATEIANIVTKVGPLGEVAGMTSGKIAAMGAALVSVGVKDDVAATGIKKLLVEMTAGTSVTKKQVSVLNDLGLSATDLAERMQTDAQGAILDFLDAVNKLPKAEQAAALSDYFGTESVGAIAPLLTKLDLLKESFDQVGDSAQYAGSMEREFESRSATTENKIILTKNSLDKLCIVLGDTFLPYITQGAEELSELVTRFSDFVEENPEAIKSFVELAAKLIALKVGGHAAKLGFSEVGKGIAGVQKVIKLFSSDVTKAGAGTAASLGGAAKAVSLLKGSLTLLTSPVGLVVGAIALLTAGIFVWMKHQEKVRQETLTFSKDLKKAADSFQEVSDKAESTKTLSDEYRQLEEKTKAVATSAEEAATAKERMRDIEDLLIEQNPDVLSKYDQENGKITENLDLLEKKTQRELELAKIQYEQQQYEAEKKLPKALNEAAELDEKTKSLMKQYEATKKLRDGLEDIVYEWDKFNLVEHTEAESSKKIEELTAKANQVGKENGASWASVGIGGGMLGIQEQYSDYVTNYMSKSSKITTDIEKTTAELATVTQSVTDYYNSGVKLAEIELGGNLQAVSDKLIKMKAELAQLESSGQNGGRTMGLKAEIAALEPKLLTAAATIRDLETAVSVVPDMKTINVEDAIKNVEGLLKKLNEIPVSKTVELIVQQRSGGKIPGYATGGIITRPTLATFAEKVPEAAIPLDGSANSKSLWIRTGKLLGMEQNTASAIAAPTLTAGGHRETSIIIHSAPVFHVASGADITSIEESLKSHDEALLNEFEARLRKRDDDERRGRYG